MDYKGFTIKIEQDDEPTSPREWDNSSHFILSHRRYDFPNEANIDFEDYTGWADLEAALQKKGYVVIVPVFLMDHSGLACNTTGFGYCDPQGWDWGPIGFAAFTSTQIREQWLLPRNRKLTAEQLEAAREGLVAEVETFNQYLTNDVWGYVIEDEDGVHLDSCWGIYGHEEALVEAKDVADHLADQRDAERATEEFAAQAEATAGQPVLVP